MQRLAPEAEATRDLYERYARQIHAFCLHTLGNREEAEDATQSTFLNAFRGLQRGIEPQFESAWLYKIAQNVCLTKQRSSSRRRKVESPGDLDALQDVLPSPAQETDELIHLPEALEGMPEQQRHALLLREWQGLSYREIAEELELSQSAVEALLFRARRSLADGLVQEPKRRGLAKRLRAGGDVGSVAALLKTLFFSGGAKLAATVVTVAASSVVAAAPGVRHSIEGVIVPKHHRIAPAQISRPAPPVRVAAPVTAPPVTAAPAPVQIAAAKVVRVTPARRHTFQHAQSHVGRHHSRLGADHARVVAPAHERSHRGRGHGHGAPSPEPTQAPVVAAPAPPMDTTTPASNNGSRTHDNHRHDGGSRGGRKTTPPAVDIQAPSLPVVGTDSVSVGGDSTGGSGHHDHGHRHG